MCCGAGSGIIERMFPLARAVREAFPSPGALTPTELVDAMTQLHQAESMLVERKLAVLAEFAEYRTAEHRSTAAPSPVTAGSGGVRRWNSPSPKSGQR